MKPLIFNKLIDAEEQTNLPCRRILNNLCRYSALKKREYDSHSLSVSTSKEYGMKREKESNFTEEKPDTDYFSQVIKALPDHGSEELELVHRLLLGPQLVPKVCLPITQ